MASIKTNTYPAFVVHPVNNIFKLPEFASQITALSGGILDNGCHSFRLFQSDVDTFCNKCQAIFY